MYRGSVKVRPPLRRVGWRRTNVSVDVADGARWGKRMNPAVSSELVML